ncbi:VanZ family protein [Microbacterium sp. ZW T6_19]|uniref:VanZ family protein n=1 Tax=Microbacterium sp. ZW T6_19 TaxID=3378082 RepID=UPI003851E8A4
MRPYLPALPVLAPLAVIAIVVLLVRLHRRTELTLPRAIVVIVGCVYTAGLVGHTLFPIPLAPESDPPEWSVWINLVPFADLLDDPSGLLLNALLFAPLGFLMPLVRKITSVWQVLLRGLLASLVIEIGQFVADLAVGLRRVADIDDLIANTVGALIGYGLFLLLTCHRGLRRIAERSSLVPSARASGRAGAVQ